MPGAAPGVTLRLSDEANHRSTTKHGSGIQWLALALVSMTSVQRFNLFDMLFLFSFLRVGGWGRISNAILCSSQC